MFVISTFHLEFFDMMMFGRFSAKQSLMNCILALSKTTVFAAKSALLDNSLLLLPFQTRQILVPGRSRSCNFSFWDPNWNFAAVRIAINRLAFAVGENYLGFWSRTGSKVNWESGGKMWLIAVDEARFEQTNIRVGELAIGADCDRSLNNVSKTNSPSFCWAFHIPNKLYSILRNFITNHYSHRISLFFIIYMAKLSDLGLFPLAWVKTLTRGADGPAGRLSHLLLQDRWIVLASIGDIVAFKDRLQDCLQLLILSSEKRSSVELVFSLFGAFVDGLHASGRLVFIFRVMAFSKISSPEFSFELGQYPLVVDSHIFIMTIDSCLKGTESGHLKTVNISNQIQTLFQKHAQNEQYTRIYQENNDF